MCYTDVNMHTFGADGFQFPPQMTVLGHHFISKEDNMGIVVIGSIFVDIKGYPMGEFVATGRNVGSVIIKDGGVSRNVAEDIANVELRPTFVSLIDDSGQGQEVLAKLKRHKINTDYIRAVPEGMGTWLAVFDNQGDVAASISRRPDLSEIDNILDEQGDEIFKDADSIVVEFDMERATLKRVFELAKKYNKDVYAVVSNMSIAIARRDLIRQNACFVCNLQEAGIFFSEKYDDFSVAQMEETLVEKVRQARIPRMVVTMGGDGAVYADSNGESGSVPAMHVDVRDTTGAGDAFFAGVTMGLTYGKDLRESCKIGTRLAASVIETKENVCPRFLPEELGLSAPAEEET